MNQQSNVIFAALFIAFLAFITMRGELRKYLGFLLSSPIGTAPAPASGGTTPGLFTPNSNSFGLPFWGQSPTGPLTDNNIFNDIKNWFGK